MTQDDTAPAATSWAYFAATMMALAGTLNVLYALVLLVNDDYAELYRAGALGLNLDAAGWLLLVVGLVQVAIALGILGAYRWVRVIGVIWAAGSVVAHLSVLAVYPVLSLLIIAIDILIIYALTVRGQEYTR
jgi:hypothetical protein